MFHSFVNGLIKNINLSFIVIFSIGDSRAVYHGKILSFYAIFYLLYIKNNGLDYIGDEISYTIP